MSHLLFYAAMAVVLWGLLMLGIFRLCDGPKIDRAELIEKVKEERRG